MDWCNDIKNRFLIEGWKSFQPLIEAFNQYLRSYCVKWNISINDQNPEGKEWVILLKDGTELYVPHNSYDTTDPATDFWIDYNPMLGGVIVSFEKKVSGVKKIDILIPNHEILDVCKHWYPDVEK